eukprot:1221899-Rhodomonas_salina.2
MRRKKKQNKSVLDAKRCMEVLWSCEGGASIDLEGVLCASDHSATLLSKPSAIARFGLSVSG